MVQRSGPYGFFLACPKTYKGDPVKHPTVKMRSPNDIDDESERELDAIYGLDGYE